MRFSFLPALRAMLALQRGDAQQAIGALSTAKRYELGFLGCCSSGFVGSLYPIYARGEAYLTARRGQEAAAEFQEILHYGGLAGSSPIGVLAYWRRGKALAMAGKLQEAKVEYQRFLSFWREANANVPIYGRVKAEYERLEQGVS